MDEYSVEFAGDDLDVELLANELSDLSVRHLSRKGDDHFRRGDEVRKRGRSGVYETSSVTLVSPWPELLDLANYIRSKQVLTKHAGIEGVAFWALMERDGQINGELSQEEIRALAELDAAYCWSVMFSPEPL